MLDCMATCRNTDKKPYDNKTGSTIAFDTTAKGGDRMFTFANRTFTNNISKCVVSELNKARTAKVTSLVAGISPTIDESEGGFRPPAG